tara:strand:- start:855 stop:1127 length:273 start_codon:yes stop_codon:yes gene_type:complete
MGVTNSAPERESKVSFDETKNSEHTTYVCSTARYNNQCKNFNRGGIGGVDGTSKGVQERTGSDISYDRSITHGGNTQKEYDKEAYVNRTD